MQQCAELVLSHLKERHLCDTWHFLGQDNDWEGTNFIDMLQLSSSVPFFGYIGIILDVLSLVSP